MSRALSYLVRFLIDRGGELAVFAPNATEMVVSEYVMGYTTTLSGTAAITPTEITTGQVGALNLNGFGYAPTTITTAFDNAEIRTYLVIARRTDQGAAHTLLGGSVSSNATQLKLASGSGNLLLILSGTTYTFTDAWPDDGETHVAALTFDESANTADLYVDGELVEAKTGVTATHAASQNLTLGAHGAGTDPFEGLIGPVAVFDRALPATEHRMAGTIATHGGPFRIRRRR
jgi:hypothetical protein